MNSNRIFRALALALPLVGLAACADPMAPAPVCDMAAIAAQRQLVAEPGIAPGAPSPLVSAPLNSVSVIDSRITRKVYVRDVQVRRTPTGTVEVASQIVNCTAFPLQAEGRTQFLDQAKFPAEPVSGWKRIFLDAHSSAYYREMSTSRDVAHYTVELREGR